MELHKINYTVIEECFLSAESKEYIEAVFKASTTGALDSELNCLKGENISSLLKSVP